MRAPIGAAVGLALAGLMLTSCSGDDTPDTLPDATPTSATPTETTTATPTADPTAALEAEIATFFEDYIQTHQRELVFQGCAGTSAGDVRGLLCARAWRALSWPNELTTKNLVLEAELAIVRRVRLDALKAMSSLCSSSTRRSCSPTRRLGGTVVEEFDASRGRTGRLSSTAQTSDARMGGSLLVISGRRGGGRDERTRSSLDSNRRHRSLASSSLLSRAGPTNAGVTHSVAPSARMRPAGGVWVLLRPGVTDVLSGRGT